MRIRHRRRESTAHQLADAIAAEQRAARAHVARRRLRDQPVPAGTMVARFTSPSTSTKLPPQAVTAAAEVVFGKAVSRKKKRPPVASWQKEAWELRSEIPEFRFAGDRVARGASQYKLYAAKRPSTPNGAPELVTEGDAFDLCQEMFGDIARTQQFLHRGGQQLTFNGESLIVVSEDEDGRLSAAAHSVSELTGQGKSWKLNNGVESRNLSEDNDLVIRCYRPDPEFEGLADCPARAVLPVARTLRALGKRTAAEIDSRLAGNGVLLVPQEIEVLPGQGGDGDVEDDPNSSPFVEALVEAMTIPIQDPDSAAAVVPLIAKVPAEVVDKIKHVTFASPLDSKVKDMEDGAIRRVALGMDSPPETLLGMSTANHWTGWLISSEEVTLVLSPTVATICHALTVGWLQPMLEAAGAVDAADYFVWFDASELELRPDKSTDSRDLHEKGALSEAAMLRENGFSETDAPEPAERERTLLTKLLLAAPNLAPHLLPHLGIDVDLPEADATTEQAAPGGVPPGADQGGGQQEPPQRPTAEPDATTETGPGQ